MKRFINRYYWYIIGLIFILIIVAWFYGLKHPSWKIFDEIYYTDFANKYLTGGEYFDVHPPLGKLLIAMGIKFFGDNPLGWRIFEAVFGIATVGLIFLLAQQLFKNKYLTLISLILAGSSTMLLVESRLSLINIFLVFFITFSILLFFLWANKQKTFYAFFCAVSFSLAMSVKWIALYLLPALILYIFINKKTKKLFYDNFICKWYNFVVLILVGLITYIAIFQLGNISEFNIIQWHEQAFGFHQNLTQTHPYASEWYTWLLMIKPICLEYKDIGEGKVVGMLEIGNLAIFWGGIVAIIYSLIRIMKNDKNKEILLFLTITVFCFMVPWLLIKRISFLYLFLPAVPILIILVSWLIYKIWQTKLKFISILLLLAAIGWFLFFYPVVVGRSINPERYQQRMWFKNWI